MKKQEEFSSTVIDTVPSPVFVVDEDMRVVAHNVAAAADLSMDRPPAIHKRSGDILHCLHSTENPDGGGRAPYCKNCIIRNAVSQSLKGNMVVRRIARAELQSGTEKPEASLLVTAAPFQYHREKYVLLILDDITELIEFKGLLPMCANCKKIRDAKNNWHHVETYLQAHADVDFSHSLCPDCYKELYPEPTKS